MNSNTITPDFTNMTLNHVIRASGAYRLRLLYTIVTQITWLELSDLRTYVRPDVAVCRYPSLATRLYSDFTLLHINACTNTRKGLVDYCWPFSSHNCHTRAISVNNIFPTDLLVYRSAIYPQGRTFKYGLGGRLPRSIHSECILEWECCKYLLPSVTFMTIVGGTISTSRVYSFSRI